MKGSKDVMVRRAHHDTADEGVILSPSKDHTLIEHFFFQRISASGFGLLRIAWAAAALWFFAREWNDIAFYYSDAGILPPELGGYVYRNDYRFSLLSFIGTPGPVFGLYLLMLVSLTLAMIGKWTRFTTVLSVILLFSFHERNLLPLGGGDTVLRNIGFLLAVAPEIRAFSIDRLRQQWKQWSTNRTLLPPLTMSIWPYRLLLWQLILIYVTSGWDKVTGTMWLNGTAVASAFHHMHFARYPLWIMDLASIPSPVFGYFTLVFEFAWLGLLLPRRIVGKILQPHALRRALIVCGILFHGGIFVFMDVGSFSLAIMAAYLGLLRDDDFVDLRCILNKRFTRSPETKNEKRGNGETGIAVLYDGICRLCRRSMFGLLMMDHLHRLQPVDFRDAALRKKVDPKLTLEDLDRAMHIKLPDGSTKQGFYAFRTMCRHLPALWIVAPLFYIPGVPFIGERVYTKIAEGRERCAEGVCRHQ